MLTKLSVRNFAVISHVELQPKPGLNVFTGETGAGKSVAISALSFVLGARGSASLIKDGADKLEVRAEFDTALPKSLLQKYGLDGKTLVLCRKANPTSTENPFRQRPWPKLAVHWLIFMVSTNIRVCSTLTYNCGF